LVIEEAYWPKTKNLKKIHMDTIGAVMLTAVDPLNANITMTAVLGYNDIVDNPNFLYSYTFFVTKNEYVHCTYFIEDSLP